MKPNALLIALPLSLLLGNNAAACSSGGLTLPERIRLPEWPQQALLLNGAGTRAKLLWEVYAGALYLPRRGATLAAILDQPGPKRIHLEFLQPVPAAKLIEGWRDGFEQNHGTAELARLRLRLERSYGYFRDMAPGDRIDLDFLPDQGTRLSLNGQPRGQIPGRDFFAGILRVWLGDHPAERALRRCLLGLDRNQAPRAQDGPDRRQG